VGSVTGIIAGVTLQATTYKLYKAGCATGDTWTDTTAADTCAPTANAPEWQPFVSVGDPHGASTGDTLVGSSCASVFYFGFAHDGVVAACKLRVPQLRHAMLSRSIRVGLRTHALCSNAPWALLLRIPSKPAVL
jgi:hypothetical protein